ncbi:hypothetical protein GGR55DRAFT_647432 [Xylaria sp. FL0064]|nr:hypothetical protein GGR55DRAFT_647432 [Xylaria sp. FL0064]
MRLPPTLYSSDFTDSTPLVTFRNSIAESEQSAISMARFPIAEASDSSARQTMEEALEIMHGGPPPFQWIQDDGQSMLGCYAPLCYTPLVAQQFFAMAKIVYSPDAVKPRNRELAILGLTSALDVPYIVYCHRHVASKIGLDAEQYADGLAGNVPKNLTEEEAMAYRLGRTLTLITGPLDEETWQEATSIMPKSEILGIVHTIAGYRWVGLLEQVNGAWNRAGVDGS